MQLHAEYFWVYTHQLEFLFRVCRMDESIAMASERLPS